MQVSNPTRTVVPGAMSLFACPATMPMVKLLVMAPSVWKLTMAHPADGHNKWHDSGVRVTLALSEIQRHREKACTNRLHNS